MNRPIKLKKKEVIELFNKQVFMPSRLMNDLGAGNAFVSNEGKIVFVFEDGKGVLYESVESLNRILENAKKKTESINIFSSKSICEDFIFNKEYLCKTICGIFKIPNKDLNYSEDSLDVIEHSIKVIGYSKCHASKYIKPIIAYVGEVIRCKVKNGAWTILETSDNLYEPIIADSHGKIYQPYFIVKKELELANKGSIRGAVNGTIN